MKLKIALVTLAVSGMIIGALLFLTNLNKPSPVLPPIQVNQSNVPSGIKSTITIPTKSAGNTTDNIKNLQDCLAHASNSEAQQFLIDQAIKNCYEKYK